MFRASGRVGESGLQSSSTGRVANSRGMRKLLNRSQVKECIGRGDYKLVLGKVGIFGIMIVGNDCIPLQQSSVFPSMTQHPLRQSLAVPSR